MAYSSPDVSQPTAGLNSPRIQVTLSTTGARMPPPRSPSRESVATELSVSSSGFYQQQPESRSTSSSRLTASFQLKVVPESSPSQQQQISLTTCWTPNRGPSPIPGAGGSNRFLKVPGASSGPTGLRSSTSDCGGCWWEEETDLNVIKSCAALSKALGLQKSFSTGDIVSLADDPAVSPDHYNGGVGVRTCVSELVLGAVQLHYERMNGGLPLFAGMGSRTLSTWVAVGDDRVAAVQQIASQLPSPQGRPTSVHVDASKADLAAFGGVSFTPADLILNLNKRVRQCYIRRRLMTTYKALERLSQSQFNLDKIAARPDFVAASVDPVQPLSAPTPPASSAQQQLLPLTLTDVERDQGRPLSKYMRNMMIFNWLHTLEDPSCSATQAEMI